MKKMAKINKMIGEFFVGQSVEASRRGVETHFEMAPMTRGTLRGTEFVLDWFYDELETACTYCTLTEDGDLLIAEEVYYDEGHNTDLRTESSRRVTTAEEAVECLLKSGFFYTEEEISK